MNKTIGMVAHVDAGKTTLVEQLLLHTNSIMAAGRVDSGNTVMDYHEIEKKRGITVYSDQITVEYNDSKFHFVDTPGHVDFSSEMERTVRILDCAVIILSAVEGIEGHTHTVWQTLRKYGVPTVFFINKMDREGADFNNVVKEIRKNFTEDICVVSEPAGSNDIRDIENLLDGETVSESIVEFLADRDDEMMEKYINGETMEYSQSIETLKSMFNRGDLFPCLCGSGLRNSGVDILLSVLEDLLATSYCSDSDFAGTVYKIRYDRTGNKEVFVKVLSGRLTVKDTIPHKNLDMLEEKVNSIRTVIGKKSVHKDVLEAGETGMVSGLNRSYVGEGLGKEDDFGSLSLLPALKSKVIYNDSINHSRIVEIFNILTEEDPLIDAVWMEELGELHINVMGIIQLEVLQHAVKERFDIDVEFGKPEVVYRETIAEEVLGFGHFEPYKHYAEVELRIAPGKRGEGILFSSECSLDTLDLKWQRNIEKNIEDGCRRGILTGSRLTDLNITLVNGKAHEKHTSGGDFRQATFRAIRHGIEQSESVLLEPYYDFTVKVSQELAGRVMSDMMNMKGIVEPPVSDEMNSIVSGMVPVSTSMNYPAELASLTGGKGILSMVFKGYDRCHNREEVISRYEYDKDSDLDYTSYSVYCSKGKTFMRKGRRD